PDLLFLVPFTLTALYLQAFFKNKVIVPIIIISLLPLLIFCQNGAVLFVMYSVAGMVSIALFPHFSKGWKPFVVAAIVFVILTSLYFGFRAIDAVNGKIWTTVAYMFVSSFLSVAGYQVIYLFEKAFNLVSNSRLEELSDTNASLIRELETKSPGTFQHSVRVMNMAETVARSIDANVLLVRAGALYHDIGKMLNPECFVENESLLHKEEQEKYHYSISPEQSAQDIIRHPADGLELAKKYGLPEIIQEFIVSHHGTTTVGYFYSKYLNAGGDPNDSDAFRYPGVTPKTKEQVILMLCDSIEAASRTLKDRSEEGYSNFVEGIVASKMNEHQFEESDVTLKALYTIKSVLKTYLSQANHERIAYPAKK
ncbi:MAG: HDIG domain-containing protein, partial [Bacteroidales bacterium]|nr:HDIG domain-containing protein [Bacteroidales bacterium]